MEFKVYYSRNGNSQFTESAIRIPRKKFCEFMNNEYRTYALKEVQEYTDLPYGEDDMCEQLLKV